MAIDIRTLLTSATATEAFAAGLEFAASVGLSTESWQEGGPTRTLLQFLALSLATRDEMASTLIAAVALSLATGDALTLLAQETYGIERTAATYSTPTVTLTNGGGGVYAKAIGELIVKSSTTGVTFRSTEAFSLASGPGTTATVALVADESGSDGTVIDDEIDEIVSTMLGVTATSSTASIGVDEESDSALRTRCTNSLGAMSSAGPPDAYNAVALDSDLTGTTEVTKAYTTYDSAYGTSTTYIAGVDGAVGASVVSAVQDAIDQWATPCAVTNTVVSATNESHDVAYTVTGTDIPATVEDDLEALVEAYFADIAIGGYLSSSALLALAETYLADAGATDVTVSPLTGFDVFVTTGKVAVVGTVTVTEV